MMETRTYAVPEMHCDHCRAAVAQGGLEGVAGVDRVDVDLDTKRVVVRGDRLDDAALIAAIDEAGYDAEPIGRSVTGPAPHRAPDADAGYETSLAYLVVTS